MSPANEDLRTQVANIRVAVEALQSNADHASGYWIASTTRADAQVYRMDAIEDSAEAAADRARVSDGRADTQSIRMDGMGARSDMDRILIAVLQAEGELTQAIAAQLQQALLSSRKIGAAIGIIMANRGIDELGAFNVLSNASQNTNRKLRDVADELLRTGDVSWLLHLS